MCDPRTAVRPALRSGSRSGSYDGHGEAWVVRRRSSTAELEKILATYAAKAAPALLGATLLRLSRGKVRAGIIVETEAYPHDDPACHAYRGQTARNRMMFGRAGLAYIYSVHRSLCLNVVTGPEGRGEAVLLRAIEPCEGEKLMARARATASVASVAPSGRALTNGPGKLCQALSVTASHNGRDLLAPIDGGSGLYLLPRETRPEIISGPRIGISVATRAPLRFVVAGNRWLSRGERTR